MHISFLARGGYLYYYCKHRGVGGVGGGVVGSYIYLIKTYDAFWVSYKYQTILAAELDFCQAFTESLSLGLTLSM